MWPSRNLRPTNAPAPAPAATPAPEAAAAGLWPSTVGGVAGGVGACASDATAATGACAGEAVGEWLRLRRASSRDVRPDDLLDDLLEDLLEDLLDGVEMSEVNCPAGSTRQVLQTRTPPIATLRHRTPLANRCITHGITTSFEATPGTSTMFSTTSKAANAVPSSVKKGSSTISVRSTGRRRQEAK
ncbi:uncharacterized protein SPSK_07982 [Sporothrix schenckii 1099-18]|uniref:Uncharacterized protein n=1 Tax=Sporothrix schenckii 1099-18 TaxID=1397361 RepID=A0A0F2MHW2_SPOSC|nr:uncharacterized protein SPSK_07982 [Sporothrix schenckii 1099-18]KJR88644.1 hypothetical protein SPSK_07982 [Sporothrix schenckii 1099-18]